MANTTADKLSLLEATKEDFKAVFAECGRTVGEVFASYPDVMREIVAGGVESVPVTIKMNGPSLIDLYYTKVLEDGSLSFTNGQATMSKALTDNMPSGSVIVGLVDYTYRNATSSTGATVSKRYTPGPQLDSTIVWAVD